MDEIPIGRWREPIMPDFPTSEAQIRWARCRAPGQRTPLPVVGEIVGLRLANYGPVVRARVTDDGMATPSDTRPGAEIDWNVWRYRTEELYDDTGALVVRRPVLLPPVVGALGGVAHRAVELVDDPWPDVTLKTLDGPVMFTRTREARLPGSAGWLRQE